MVTTMLEPMRAHAGRAFRPVGAQVQDGGVIFRVWAPNHRDVRVVTGDSTHTRYVNLEPEADAPGFLSGRDDYGRPGDFYWYQLRHDLAPDPASRFQPRGVGGPSQVIDPAIYDWRTTRWQRPPLKGRTIYELHVGAFSPEGTFLGAISRLPALVDLGVNTIELMPLACFAGARNWGYDGVFPFAPANSYGTPDELCALIDAAHASGLAVIVDVVYNHLGPCGNVLPKFSPHYLRPNNASVWGAALNFDGEHSTPVREYFLQNACMWFDEYRVDGLRLDAVHAIHDSSRPHFIAEVAALAAARGGFTIAEDERNDARIITPTTDGGWGVDGMWSDDFHHALRVGATGRREAHLANYTGTIDEWHETLREGWFYRGQIFQSWQRPRGTPAAHLSPEKFVLCISNHDQIGNRPLGDRLSEVVDAATYRALSMLLCLAPYTPLLFMGQEWAARTPFPYFTDLPGEVGVNMAQNRLNEFLHYGATYPPEELARMPDPQAETTFRAAKLAWTERERAPHAGVLALYRECLHLRAAHAVFQSRPRDQWSVEKRNADVLELRWSAGWRLLVSVAKNASVKLELTDGWERVLASNDARFGGAAATELLAPGATLWRKNKP